MGEFFYMLPVDLECHQRIAAHVFMLHSVWKAARAPFLIVRDFRVVTAKQANNAFFMLFRFRGILQNNYQMIISHAEANFTTAHRLSSRHLQALPVSAQRAVHPMDRALGGGPPCPPARQQRLQTGQTGWAM